MNVRRTTLRVLMVRQPAFCAALAACALLASGLAVSRHAAAAPKNGARVKAGTVFRDCRTCPDMVVIPAGKFVMGTPETEKERDKDEYQHEVTIARPFALGRTEVTWDQWEACVRDGACDGAAVDAALRQGRDGKPDPNYKDWGRGNRPVVGVSWYDAQHYVGWLNRKTGQDDAYRLASEAEWEYAARAGTRTAFYWGEEFDHDRGNFGRDGHELGPMASGRDVWENETAPVGSFPPNAFGLYDMAGNAFEWIEDCYLEDLRKGPSDGSANKNGSCATREFRSGTFISNPHMQRSGNRIPGYVPTTRGRNYLSFRVAKTLD
ncbi:MAG TPA: formylglycine-generating enzyme family protein [Gammaproteobacteria bacterium]|nr:formylglycine-generating enzyme family protein [Gammaproteobacteria bacterium]